MCSAAARARADALFATDFKNTTGQVVNDYHIKLEADKKFKVSDAFSLGLGPAPSTGFPDVSITGNNSTAVTLNFSGATLNPGDSTWVAALQGWFAKGPPPGLTVTESWWTVGGIRVHPPKASLGGLLLTPESDGIQTASWNVERITLYDSLAGTYVVGHEWSEAQTGIAAPTNSSGETLFYSTATFVSPTEIPLDQLNLNLGGFGQESPISSLRPTPEPSALILGLLGGLAVLLEHEYQFSFWTWARRGHAT
jgi:hypothetical protein